MKPTHEFAPAAALLLIPLTLAGCAKTYVDPLDYVQSPSFQCDGVGYVTRGSNIEITPQLSQIGSVSVASALIFDPADTKQRRQYEWAPGKTISFGIDTFASKSIIVQLNGTKDGVYYRTTCPPIHR